MARRRTDSRALEPLKAKAKEHPHFHEGQHASPSAQLSSRFRQPSESTQLILLQRIEYLLSTVMTPPATGILGLTSSALQNSDPLGSPLFSHSGRLWYTHSLSHWALTLLVCSASARFLLYTAAGESSLNSQ